MFIEASAAHVFEFRLGDSTCPRSYVPMQRGMMERILLLLQSRIFTQIWLTSGFG